MGTYVVNFTNINVSPINVFEQTVDNTSLDISLFGYIRLKYGDQLQENILHLLENFACPEDVGNPGNPDLGRSYGNILENPTIGQFWYNSSTQILNHWNGLKWVPVRGMEDVSANWGTIGHGQQLPRPVSQTSGYVFPYSECIWSVSPAGYDGPFHAVNCSTETDSRVIMQYRLYGADYLIPGNVNYLIIGIRGNKNLGSLIAPPPIIGVSPTPTPTIGAITPTPSITPTNKVTPTQTPTQTPTPTVTPTKTPAASPEPLGINTRLYTSPSPGDPGSPGPGGTNTQLLDTCGPTITYDQFTQSYYISLQNLSGGIPPYYVDFSGVNFPSDISGDQYLPGGFAGYDVHGLPIGVAYPLPAAHFVITYAGGMGSDTSYLRENMDSTNIPRMIIKPAFDNPALFFNDRTYIIRYSISGKVILYDSVGQSINFWIPKFPTEIGGSAITDDSIIEGVVHPVTWGHYELCSQCPNCV